MPGFRAGLKLVSFVSFQSAPMTFYARLGDLYLIAI